MSVMAARPRLRRIGPGVWETRDRRFRIERRPVSGPRGGRGWRWWFHPTVVGSEWIEVGPFASLRDAGVVLAPRVRGWSGLAADSGMVYLVHLDEPFGHARHYLGWTNAESVDERLARHRSGRGARLLKHVNAAGIAYRVVRVWPGGRARERQLKRQGGAARLCPVCKAEKGGF